jgi:hypothetical protein
VAPRHGAVLPAVRLGLRHLVVLLKELYECKNCSGSTHFRRVRSTCQQRAGWRRRSSVSLRCSRGLYCARSFASRAVVSHVDSLLLGFRAAFETNAVVCQP